ncbi:MAG: serine/threonine-protein kinase [Cyanobacteria bacterium P01_D01_bin.71]
MAALAHPEPKPGDIVGHHLLIKELGRGGMGIVFSARPSQAYSTEPLALKWFRPDRVSAETVRAIGNRLTQIHHPALVQTIEVDQHGKYLVMEQITGEALGSLLKRCGRLARNEFEILTRQLCDGLTALHKARLLHRDVRPANMIATSRGWVLVDLGIPYSSLSASDKAANLAQRGPRSYMAPEVLKGQSSLIASDIYSASITLYHALVGRRPNRDRLGNHLGRPKFEKGLNPSLLDVFYQGASAHPKQRFSTVAELKLSILNCLIQHPNRS